MIVHLTYLGSVYNMVWNSIKKKKKEIDAKEYNSVEKCTKGGKKNTKCFSSFFLLTSS